MEPFLLLSIHQSAVRTVVSFHSSVSLCNLNLFSLTFAFTSAGSVGMLPHTVMWMRLWVKTQWKLGSEHSVSVSSQYIMLTSFEQLKCLKVKQPTPTKSTKKNKKGAIGCLFLISLFCMTFSFMSRVVALLLSPRDNFYIQQKISETIQSTL